MIQLRDFLLAKESNLKAEYENREKKNLATAVAKEKQRLMKNLHDGVLCYLSTIHALTDGINTEPDTSISRLAKVAIREIRLSLELEGRANCVSLFETCSNPDAGRMRPSQMCNQSAGIQNSVVEWPAKSEGGERFCWSSG